MKIALLGDIALIGRYDRTLVSDVSNRIKCVRELTKDCDFVIANLEAPLTSCTSSLMCKGVYLRSDPVNIETLQEMGITHVSLANNHIFDYGKKGAYETCQILESAGIQYVGLGFGPAILSKGNEIVYLEGFCCLSANALKYGTTEGKVHILIPETIESFLRLAAEEHVFPIVSVHFGLEGLHYPSIEHLALFRSLAKKYHYILHGNHPHAIQGVEHVNRSLLIYAQGNLCFDEAKKTSIGAARVEKEEERKCYITIVDIEDHVIQDHIVISLTDMPNGIIHQDDRIGEELANYSKALSLPVNRIIELRQNEIKDQREKAAERDFRFFMNRMNYRYIGAFINGIRQGNQYKRIFRDYF